MSDDQYITFGLAEKYAEEIREARQAESYARHFPLPMIEDDQIDDVTPEWEDDNAE